MHVSPIALFVINHSNQELLDKAPNRLAVLYLARKESIYPFLNPRMMYHDHNLAPDVVRAEPYMYHYDRPRTNRSSQALQLTQKPTDNGPRNPSARIPQSTQSGQSGACCERHGTLTNPCLARTRGSHHTLASSRTPSTPKRTRGGLPVTTRLRDRGHVS